MVDRTLKSKNYCHSFIDTSGSPIHLYYLPIPLSARNSLTFPFTRRSPVYQASQPTTHFCNVCWDRPLSRCLISPRCTDCPDYGFHNNSHCRFVSFLLCVSPRPFFPVNYNYLERPLISGHLAAPHVKHKRV